MTFFYPTLAAMAVLLVFVLLVARQNRDLLRVRAYAEFLLRLLPLLSAGILVVGLPLVMRYTTSDNAIPVLLVYLGGTAVLTAVMARAVAPEERRAGALFRRHEYEGAAETYRTLLARRPLPRHYSALAASLDAAGDPEGALEAADAAVKLDPKLGVALYNRASVLAALGEPARARADLQAVFRADSGRRLKRAAQEALEGLEKG